jgi:hypothetical protein
MVTVNECVSELYSIATKHLFYLVPPLIYSSFAKCITEMARQDKDEKFNMYILTANCNFSPNFHTAKPFLSS